MELGKVANHLRNPNTRTGRAVLFGTTLGSAALLASGCGGGSSTTTVIERAPAAGNVPTKAGHHTPSKDEQVHAQLTFDYLGAGSTIVEVYPGVANTPEDKHADGTFPNGETVGAICKTEGREVHSERGEEQRASDEWAKLADSPPDEEYYASFVYTTDPHQLMMELPDC